MVLALNYRRPSHVSSSRASLNGDDKQKSINESIVSGSSTSYNGIPEALSFDRIIAGGVCPVSPAELIEVSLTDTTLALHNPRLLELPQIH